MPTRTSRIAAARPDWLKRVVSILLGKRWLSGRLVAKVLVFVPALSPMTFVRVGTTYQRQGRGSEAAWAFSLGGRRFPNSSVILRAQARHAALEGRQEEACAKWLELLAAGSDLLPTDFRELSRALRDQGDREGGQVALGLGLERWPSDPKLLAERGRLALAGHRSDEAIKIFKGLIGRASDDLAPWAYRHLASAHAQKGDFESADCLLQEARVAFPHHPVIELTWARLPLMNNDPRKATSRWQEVASRHSKHISEEDIIRVVQAYRRVDDLIGARAALELARKEGMRTVRLSAEAAQVGMASRDWAFALRGWQTLVDHSPTGVTLPQRGSPPDWFELAWHDLAVAWEDATSKLDESPSPDLHLTVAWTLEDAGLYDDALLVLRHGMDEHPESSQLAARLAAAEIRRFPIGSTQRRQQIGELIEGPFRHQAPVAKVLRRLRDGVSTFDDLSLLAEPEFSAGGLGRLRVIHLPENSSLELEAKAGHYLAPRDIERLVHQISTRDRWPEIDAPNNVMLQTAQVLAAQFGEEFEELPWLPADTLADAVLLILYHELALFLPMNRIAKDISKEAGREPVLIECPSTSLKYLDGYTFGRFDIIYLFFELRRRGANAYICVPEANPSEVSTFDFLPGIRLLRPKGSVEYTDVAEHKEGLFPAGIRSVPEVQQMAPDALLYSSASVIKEFAYDRSLEQAMEIRPEASIYPEKLPQELLRFNLLTVKRLGGFSWAGEGEIPVTASVQTSEPLGGTWFEWLDRVLSPLLREMAIRSLAEVNGRRIETAHVCDHIFPDTAIFADTVKRSGGNVVLWPHSANPVHVGVRRTESFDEVHAVTKAGVEAWRSQYPGKKAHQSPQLMLTMPNVQELKPNEPISVVVVGGRSTLGDMPILDVDAHKQSYRCLFEGLDRLRDQHDLDVRFKPRGLTGEHELWLHQTVGRLANWQPVYEHPMRMTLPNMLFVSVSSGTSALIEGLSRGIPGLVVRDFHVRDYTAFGVGAVPTLKCVDAVELIKSCLVPGGLRSLIDQQVPHYEHELRPDAD